MQYARLTATYSSDGNYAGSTLAQINLNSTAEPTTLTLTLIPPKSVVGQQSTLVATLSPYNYGTDTTNGETVSFMNNGTVFGTGPSTTALPRYNTAPASLSTFPSRRPILATPAASNASASNTINGTVLQSSTLTWANPAPITYGTPLSSAQLNATDNAPGGGTFIYTPAAGTVLPAGTRPSPLPLHRTTPLTQPRPQRYRSS